jgi:hypothetical protein
MRRIAVHMQATFNNRIANADGGFWEPFACGQEEMADVNQFFRAADTWALSRKLYEAIVPWWDDPAEPLTPPGQVTPSGLPPGFSGDLVRLADPGGQWHQGGCQDQPGGYSSQGRRPHERLRRHRDGWRLTG